MGNFIKLVQADRDRRFYGTIHRGSNSDGHPVVRDRIKVNNGFILAQAACQDVLGSRLEALVVMVLDYDLNSIPNTDFIESPTKK